MTDKQYDDANLDSKALDPTDLAGNPHTVTITLKQAHNDKVV